MMNEPLQQIKSSIQGAYAFDVHESSGFMPPEPPIAYLPQQWIRWELALESAINGRLQLGEKVNLTHAESSVSKDWRQSICEVRFTLFIHVGQCILNRWQMPTLSVVGLEVSPALLRRAHLVLAYVLHFFVQSIPLEEPILIPTSISLPILKLSQILDLPPVLTFSDTVLYNWNYKTLPTSSERGPNIHNICSRTLFTGLRDEEEFYLCSARIELRGVEVLELMRMTMDETFVGDAIAAQRITKYLTNMASVIDELKVLLLDVKEGCDPDVYYNQVRPWFRGEDSDEVKRKWIFEGIEDCPGLCVPTELSGPSAGQSSLVHVLDIFLGVDHQATSPGQLPFMSRMQAYMPRNHRLFLDHLKASPRPLRTFVRDAGDAELLAAYNCAIAALKTFRDAHMIIVTLYILGPARRAKLTASKAGDLQHGGPMPSKDALKGTGGTNLIKFLKDTRTRTVETLIQADCDESV